VTTQLLPLVPYLILVVKVQLLAWLPSLFLFWSSALPARSLTPEVMVALYLVLAARVFFGVIVTVWHGSASGLLTN
jgi:hypothetical protein